MKNPYLSNYAFSFILLLSFFSVSPKLYAQQRPNILYILVDDLGYGDLGVLFQNQKDKELPKLFSPNLDKMAESGAILTQQYANAPVCAPSRASLLTGVNQGNAHVRDNQFDKALENNHTLASVLKTAGYTTVAIGKWGLQGENEKQKPNWPAHPLKRGFDTYFGYMRHADGHEHYPVEGTYRGKKEIWSNYEEVSAGYEKCYTTDLWTAKAKDFIINFEKQNTSKKPFFMFLAYDAPHAVLELPTQEYPAGAGLQGGLQWIGQKGKMINTASGTVDSYIHPDYANATYDDDKNPNTPNVAWPETYKRYATAVRRLDDAVGDIRKLLTDLKIADNTLVVFSSDNGPSIESYLPKTFAANKPTFFESYGPFDGIKRDCWEGGVRMPVLVSWPNHIPAKKIVTTPSMLSDWLPTFAAVAKTPIPVRTTGVSLLPSLTNTGKQDSSLVYVEYFETGSTPNFNQFEKNHRSRKRNQMQLIRVGDYIGVRYNIQSADDSFEIYNVINDPKETNNLGNLKEYQGLQAQMKAKVLQARATDAAAARPYDAAAIPGIQLPKNVKKGLNWSFYAGNYSYIAAQNNSKPNQTGTSKSITPALSTASGITVYTAFIKIAAKGTYILKLNTPEKAFVKLHQFNLLDADYGYTGGTSIEKSITLEAGYHPISIYYLHNKGKKGNLSIEIKSAEGVWEKLSDKNCLYE
ncbi:sulfatase-like hydrolase/transferase [Pedobacter sp. MW01-1-1]|uniref:sulfatase-like hydrolase/transferase n=1 Tax=Pedobacter sp. MW01-1-1 TaxID=3383027 RepID=UPI003FEF6044